MAFLSLRLAIPLALIAALLSGCVSPAPLHNETRELSTVHISSTPIKAETKNGYITVTSNDQEDVSVIAHIKATTQARLEATEIAIERTKSGTLSISAKWPDGKVRNRESCSFEIIVPEAHEVDLRSSNGRLEISGLSGEGSLETSNGKIVARDHRGNIEAKTSNGAIIAEGISGNVDLKTSNGRISVDQVHGSVEAKTSNGAIHITSSPNATEPIDARTSNGPITLLLGNTFEGELFLKTSNGGINTSDLENARFISSKKNQIQLQFGDSTKKSEAITSNGKITVRGQ